MKGKSGILMTGLKLMTLISLYIAFTGFLAALLGSVTPIFLSVGCIFVFTMFSAALRKVKFVWILPLILGASAFYIEYRTGGLSINLLWILPVYVYGIVFNAKKLYYFDKYSAVKSSPLIPSIAWTVPFISVFGSGISNVRGADNGSVFFGVAFLICSIVLLRYSRHKRTTVDTPQFRIMNIEAILLLTATAFIFAGAGIGLWIGMSKVFLFIGSLGKEANVAPVITETPPPTPEPTETPTYAGIHTPRPDLPEPQGHPIDAGTAGLIIGIVILVIAAYLIVFRVRKARGFSDAEVSEGERLARKKRKAERSSLSRRAGSNRNTVRKCYRKFIRLCRESFIDIKESSTAKEIKDAAVAVGFSPEECDSLYRIYLLARYSDAEVTDADAKDAAYLYRKIKGNRHPKK